IGDTVIRPGPATFRPHEIVLSVSHKHEGTFNVPLGRNLLVDGAVGKGLQSGEVVFEPDYIAMTPASVNQIVLVLVFEYKLIDRLCAVVNFANQGFAKVVFKGPCRAVGDGYTYPANFAFMNIVGA